MGLTLTIGEHQVDGRTADPEVLSAKTYKQFDCTKGRFRVLAVVEYSGKMATGKLAGGYIENGNWQRVEPQRINQMLWNMACNNS